jgi:rod shape-determining protein MreD
MIFFYIIITLGAVVVQSTLIPVFYVLNSIGPDFIMMMIIYVNLQESDPLPGETIAFGTGLMEDFLSTGLLGLNAFSKTVISFLINLIKDKISLDKYLPMAGFVATVCLANEIIYLTFQAVFIGNIPFFRNLFLLTLPSAIYTGLLAPLIFYLLNMVRNRLLRLRK